MSRIVDMKVRYPAVYSSNHRRAQIVSFMMCMRWGTPWHV